MTRPCLASAALPILENTTLVIGKDFIGESPEKLVLLLSAIDTRSFFSSRHGDGPGTDGQTWVSSGSVGWGCPPVADPATPSYRKLRGLVDGWSPSNGNRGGTEIARSSQRSSQLYVQTETVI